MTRTDQQATQQPSVVIDTLGCKLNIADSDLLAKAFLAAGFTQGDRHGLADVYVLNTCTVTGEADAKARQQLRRARRRYPNALVVATGCYPARARAEVEALGLADLVADNAEKPALAERLRALLNYSLPADAPPYRASFPLHRTRAFVKVQEGCNDYCTYCIIPQTRGSSRFFAAATVVDAILEREREGHQEVVLTGTQIGDYGIELSRRLRAADPRDQGSEGEPLAALLAAVLSNTSIPRIRLSSLQPQDVTPVLLGFWQDPRLCPHFHLPLQSGSDRVLGRMRRRYTAQEFADAVQRVRSVALDAAVTSDLIVGFPGETESDFEASLHACRAAALSDVHVFPFSPRPRTLAARYAEDPAQAVPEQVKRRRVHEALGVAAELRQQALARAVGQQRTVLWEDRTEHDGVSWWSGLTDTYLRVTAAAPQAERGTIATVHIQQAAPDHLIGRVVA